MLKMSKKCFVFLLLIFSACIHLQVRPDYSKIENVLSKEITTDHFIFHLSPNDSIRMDWQENYYSWLTKKLNINPNEKIHYYKYKDVEQKYLLTKTKGNAIVLFNRIHTIIPYDNHELVHVLIGKYVGNPPKLFTEGMAIAHQTNPSENDFVPKWGKKPIDEIVHELDKSSQIPPLDSLLVMSNFFKFDETVTYPVSGSFVKYLINKYSLEIFYSFVEECDWQSPLIEIKQKFEKIYKKEISSCWNEWLSYISLGKNQD